MNGNLPSKDTLFLGNGYVSSLMEVYEEDKPKLILPKTNKDKQEEEEPKRKLGF